MGEEKLIWKSRWFKGAVIYAILFLFIVTTANISTINAWLGRLMAILRPVWIGLAIAYLCNPFFRFFEQKAFFKLRPAGLRRAISLICTYLSIILIIVLLLALILPQLASSIGDLVQNYESYSASAVAQLNKGIDKINNLVEQITKTPGMLPHLDASALSGWVLNWIKSIDLQNLDEFI